MPDTTQKYKIYQHKFRKGYVLIEELNVRNVYDSRFWHRPMPTIGDRKCKEILKKMYPHMKADGVLVLIENVKTGETYTQKLHRNGTILLI